MSKKIFGFAKSEPVNVEKIMTEVNNAIDETFAKIDFTDYETRIKAGLKIIIKIGELLTEAAPLIEKLDANKIGVILVELIERSVRAYTKALPSIMMTSKEINDAIYSSLSTFEEDFVGIAIKHPTKILSLKAKVKEISALMKDIAIEPTGTDEDASAMGS